MIGKRTWGTARRSLLAGLTAAAVLGSGLAAGGPVAVAATRSGPARAASRAARQPDDPLGGHGAACSVTTSGRLVNCPRPVPRGQLPAGARNQARATRTVSNLASLVDTRTWTSDGGNTFPGADVPFGMVQWSPDTLPSRSDGGGYTYGDSTLDGYSLTHLSGPGCPSAGDVPVLPMTGTLPGGNPNSVTTSFTNDGEVAEAGYYSARSNAPDTITSRFTATPHTSMGDFAFPRTTGADFLIKLMDSQAGDFGDSAQIGGNDEVTGTDTSGHFCRETDNGGQVQLYTVHFAIIFSQPFTASKVITESGQRDPAAVFLTFNTTSDPVIAVKVAISYVSTGNAELDLRTENPGWDFDRVRAAAQRSWNRLLRRIRVSGGNYAQTQEFYSLLYKDFLQPNVTSDVNGQFLGADDKVHTLAPGQKNQYGMYSGWDIYHSLAQLQAMLDPQAASDMAQSQVNYYAENGVLQQWGYLNLDNFTMVGDPEDSIISDYYAFGARHFDTKQALADMVKQATTVNDVRPGEALEREYGYLPADGSYGCCNPHGVVASLLEYDTADLALAQFAAALGDAKDAAALERRAGNWENQFDPSNGLLTPRDENGQFIPGITRLSEQDSQPYYVEGDAYEYLWDVPNDYPALFSLLGGDAKVAPELRRYLSQPNGYGLHPELSNEFDLGEQYAPDYVGDPAGTEQAISDIRDTLFLPGPDGLTNNDDLGAESSQFIWEMLGLYPENPGSDNLLLDSPGFPHAAISLPGGHTVTISAPGASPQEYYVQSLKINGKTHAHLYVPFSTLSRGATVDWTLGTRPGAWGTAPRDAPPSYPAGLRPVVGYASSQRVTVVPGGVTTVRVQAQNATGSAQTVHASEKAPSGLSVTASPASGQMTVPPSGRGSVTLTIHASASAAQNVYTIPVSLSDGRTTLPPVRVTVLVATSGSLLGSVNNAGISNDSDVRAANFDNVGDSYSAQALAAAGLAAGRTVSVDGVRFTWPAPPPGDPDNVVAGGQRVTLNAPAGTQRLAFLGSSSYGPSEGVATLHYSDGSTARFWLGLSDWTLNGGKSQPSYGNQVAARMTYRNCSACSSRRATVSTDVFYAALPVDPGKVLRAVTLPRDTPHGTLHVFAVGTSSRPPGSPVADLVSPATAAAGQRVTLSGSGFGSSQGSGHVAFSDEGINWGAPGNRATFHVDSWSNSAITFTVPTPSGTGGGWAVTPGSLASVTVQDSSGASSAALALEITPTSDPVDYYDNTGISADNQQSCANYDGDGNSYSATALADAGLKPGAKITADGLSFTWPGVACAHDNILAAGQTMLVHGLRGDTRLGLLGASTSGPSAGTLVISYTDGTSSTEPVSLLDWASPPGDGDTAAATMPYRNHGGTSQRLTVRVFATTVPVDPFKTVASITFPYDSNPGSLAGTAMHIFAVSLG